MSADSPKLGPAWAVMGRRAAHNTSEANQTLKADRQTCLGLWTRLLKEGKFMRENWRSLTGVVIGRVAAGLQPTGDPMRRTVIHIHHAGGWSDLGGASFPVRPQK
jgi:hypothetical protein